MVDVEGLRCVFVKTCLIALVVVVGDVVVVVDVVHWQVGEDIFE